MRLDLETTSRAAERVHVYRVAHADWLRLEGEAAG
jgi:hypothetical protein